MFDEQTKPNHPNQAFEPSHPTPPGDADATVDFMHTDCFSENEAELERARFEYENLEREFMSSREAFEQAQRNYSTLQHNNPSDENTNNEKYTYMSGLGFMPDNKQVREKKELKRNTNIICLSILTMLFTSSLIISPLVIGLMTMGFQVSIDPVTYAITASPFMIQIIKMIVYIVTTALPAFLILLLFKNNKPLTPLFRMPTGRFLPSYVLIFLGITIISSISIAQLQSVLTQFGVITMMPAVQLPTTIGGMIIYTISIAVLPALLEEFLFRGVILHSLRRFGDTFAIILSSIFFALVHANILQAMNAFVLGVVISYFVIKTGSIWTGVILHFTNNFFALLMNMIGEYGHSDVVSTLSAVVSLSLLILGVLAFIHITTKDPKIFTLKQSTTCYSTAKKLQISLGGIIPIVTILWFGSRMFSSFQLTL